MPFTTNGRVNKMRQALTDEELRHWCKLIVEGGPESCLL
jgi:hypothetical protein